MVSPFLLSINSLYWRTST